MQPDPTRRRYLALAGAGAAGTLAVPEAALGRSSATDSLRSHLDNRVPELLERYDVPGACIAVVEDGDPVWTEAYGEADREAGRPMTADTVFRVASITKSVTAWAVLTLVEAGEVGLDDPIEEYVTRWTIPNADEYAQPVTVRRLLENSSGLSMRHIDDEDVPYAPNEDVPTPEEVLSGLGTGPPARLEHDPGSAFQYSNAGFVLLELLIEEVTGREFEAYVAEAVLDPLRMDGATLTWDEGVREAIAAGYLQDGSRGPVFVDPVKAPGGLYATAGDIARFVAAGMTGPDGQPPGRGVLEPETVASLHTPAVETSGYYGLISDAYGLGHFVETLPDGRRAVSHGGHHTGWLSHYYGVPETGDGIVVLTNSRRAQRFVADVMDAWAERRRLAPTAMSRAYSRVVTGVRATIGVAGLAAAGLGWRLGRGLRSGDRRFDPFAREAVRSRLVLGVLAILLVGAWWGLGRDVLAPLLPVLTGWLTVALIAVAVLAMALVLFPRTASGERE